MARKKAYGAQKMPPDGRLRRSQLLTSFGPGAMLDLIDAAVLVGGLDFWRPSDGGGAIHEPRLRAAVEDVMVQRGRTLSVDRPFRWPPAGDEETPNEGVGVQVYEFPRWFVCQNTECRAVVKANQLAWRANHYWHSCGGADRKEERSVPMRWVGSCKKGHLVDVDWPYWVHERELCETPRLRLDEGSSGDFAEIVLRCTTCNKWRQLADFNLVEKAPFCTGDRPWLGMEGREECTEKLRLLTRTATNTYFSQTMSALSIPERPSVREAVMSQWQILQAATRDGLKHFRAIPAVAAALGSASDEEVWQAIEDIRANRTPPMKDIRSAEFEQFMAQPVERPGEMPPDDPDPYFWAREHRPEAMPPGLGRIVLARLLREVVTQIGFTRHEPATVDLQGRYDLGVEPAPLSLLRDWLPAVEIKGEGIFLQLDEDEVRRWEEEPAVRARIAELKAGFDAWRASAGSKMEFLGGRFYLLHTLSHLLMNALSLECGYPASAIKERIYCAGADAPRPMAAILLSTGTSGVEGTLGGLVEEGRRMDEHLARALREGKLCSNDPVCAQHRPTEGGERYLEGAACHGCLFVAECSCERFNQFLDRALVAPTLGHEDVAFFGPRLSR